MKKKIIVKSMTFEHGLNNVVDGLMEIGVRDVDIKKLVVTAEISTNITDEIIKAAIEEAGYDVVKIETSALQYAKTSSTIGQYNKKIV
ncbi:heavy metal transport/detoxification protein [Clostridium bowmanii]|uniref:heavy metal transport/detoxification protein n=1 Tax=Clostridium bowmanii TaxID=132925 RepID=UPI001C0C689E|nr:heavy metal transport/detoxification protein [Clostridium bowmanii]MBU3192263.1 heavy metal transport/detoxification protein [Clostridium bowmanii]MCA1076497.1 heavy metal transport/detoxification protein [Clostridium bowmanii]